MRIYARSFTLTGAIREHVWMRIGPILEACDMHPDIAQIWLDDVNGDHGGEDKRCRISVSGRGINGVVVEAVDRDLYVAVDIAAGRLRASLRRQLGRRRTLQREPATSWASLTSWGPRGEEPSPAA